MNSIRIKAGIVLMSAILTFTAFDHAQSRQYQAEVSGTITVDRNIDPSGDFSGIAVGIMNLRTDGSPDTLFFARTDETGNFSGTARFSKKNDYFLVLSRHGRTLSTSSVILADGETLKITGELPDFGATKSVSSHENDAMQSYRRVERNYNRIVDYINSGATEVTQDTIPKILETWSDLFWSMRENFPNTIAGEYGALRSAEIVAGYHDDLLIARSREAIGDRGRFLAGKTVLAADAMARKQSIDQGVAFIDSVMTLDIPEDDHITLEMSKIQLLIEYDESESAMRTLRDFRNKYGDREFIADWAEEMLFDLENLAPGTAMPSFEFRQKNGRTLRSDDLAGTHYLLEFVDLTDQNYHIQYTIMSFFYDRFSEDGVEYITIPLSDSEVAVRAFFEERGQKWRVAAAGVYGENDLLKKLNVNVAPTRFLVDNQGKIVRKYSGTDISIIQNDIRELLDL